MHHFGSDAELRSFREQTMAAISPQSSPTDALRVWRDLTEGRASILDAFTTAEYSYLVTTRAVLHLPISQRSLQMLERVLAGRCPKQVAAEFNNIALSTMTCVLKHALERLGSDAHPSKAPLGLVALLHAARAPGQPPQVYSSSAHLLGIECDVHLTPLPSLSHVLPRSVADVVLLHAAGKSHREIAAIRGRSARTVANQLATAFQRMGHSGRLSMLEFLFSQREESRLWGHTG